MLAHYKWLILGLQESKKPQIPRPWSISILYVMRVLGKTVRRQERLASEIPVVVIHITVILIGGELILRIDHCP